MLDIKITGGRIIDGTGSPWFGGDLGVKAGKMCLAGPRPEKAKTEIKAGGCFVTPGFIDIHTHADGILDMPLAENFLRQGVTTVVSGNCGTSHYPVRSILEKVEECRPAINYATLAGLGTIRKRVMGMARRAPTKQELSRMCRLVEKSMREGALGVSSGLFYVPGEYARLNELVELAKAAGSLGGFYATHARSAGGKIPEAVREAAAVGKRARIPVQISHLKVLHKRGRTGKNRADEVLAIISGLRQEVSDITFDVHPYPATCTGLYSVVIPPRVSEGGKLIERLKDKSFRNKIRDEVSNKIAWIGGPGRITISQFSADRALEGRTLDEIAADRGKDAITTAFELIIEGQPNCIFHALRQEDVMKIALSENCMFASDGKVVSADSGAVHPRCYGTFPRIFREHVREKQLLRPEEAVRKMTSFPAGKCGLHDRGLIKPGMRADLAVFSRENFSDKATFQSPHSFPAGLKCVVVNGEIAWERARALSRAGAALRKQ